MGGMGTAWRESTRVPALRVPMLLMGLGEVARALGQPSEASTPSVLSTPADLSVFLAVCQLLAREGARGAAAKKDRRMRRLELEKVTAGAQSRRVTAREC